MVFILLFACIGAAFFCRYMHKKRKQAEVDCHMEKQQLAAYRLKKRKLEEMRNLAETINLPNTHFMHWERKYADVVKQIEQTKENINVRQAILQGNRFYEKKLLHMSYALLFLAAVLMLKKWLGV
ncbi:hypothetical protein P6P90_12610 [Ectobacillus antri]|jgi:hypothetical protein|uniref:Uncharacterized protein n=1 Tax=Ectobacillus antri TaxID=2486280 RepID=A0ABT6H813_9BACI|nr:hypothetical protein [Ectobacillus antri]MDG4657804.1 hypothetical protein [Ectobacillus antri]MDG5754805.1 hypothetical protein [Ectobacillus antri]